MEAGRMIATAPPKGASVPTVNSWAESDEVHTGYRTRQAQTIWNKGATCPSSHLCNCPNRNECVSDSCMKNSKAS